MERPYPTLNLIDLKSLHHLTITTLNPMVFEVELRVYWPLALVKDIYIYIYKYDKRWLHLFTKAIVHIEHWLKHKTFSSVVIIYLYFNVIIFTEYLYIYIKVFTLNSNPLK